MSEKINDQSVQPRISRRRAICAALVNLLDRETYNIENYYPSQVAPAVIGRKNLPRITKKESGPWPLNRKKVNGQFASERGGVFGVSKSPIAFYDQQYYISALVEYERTKGAIHFGLIDLATCLIRPNNMLVTVKHVADGLNDPFGDGSAQIIKDKKGRMVVGVRSPSIPESQINAENTAIVALNTFDLSKLNKVDGDGICSTRMVSYDFNPIPKVISSYLPSRSQGGMLYNARTTFYGYPNSETLQLLTLEEANEAQMPYDPFLGYMYRVSPSDERVLGPGDSSAPIMSRDGKLYIAALLGPSDYFFYDPITGDQSEIIRVGLHFSR